MQSENAVEFEHVSKTYAIYDQPGDRLRELISPGRKARHRDFYALRDVTFSVAHGEVFCIVGENGSGKSTALQIMAGIMEPTAGEVRVSGRVAALLELGAGFNPEFSGRDNVFLNAAIMGLTQSEIEQRFPAIEAFAEIGAFIDQPVKTYSSGMSVRLAFAVAINLDPEVLIVDEALAVGDSYFRHRCMRRVHELRARGVTIIFVSHSASDVKAIGDRVLWLEHGRTMALGGVDEVLPLYLKAMADREGNYAPPDSETHAPGASVEPVLTLPNIDHRSGDGRATILGIAVLNEYAEPFHLMTPGMSIVIRITFHANVPLPEASVGFVLRNHLGFDFSEVAHRVSSVAAGIRHTISLRVELPELYPGAFSFSPFVSTCTGICDQVDNPVTVQMGRGEGPVYGYIHVPCRIDLTDGAATNA